MPDSLTPEPESDLVCECKPQMRSACAGELSCGEHEGKRYCVLHLPSKEKSAEFTVALRKKLVNKDFDFSGVWFPDEVSFIRFDFSAIADFSFATFGALADFSSATFRGKADFSYATFNAEAAFGSAAFKKAVDFSSATFTAKAFFSYSTLSAAADFSFATFGADSDFGRVTFSAPADFSKATFSAAASFIHVTFGATASFSSATFRAVADFSYAAFGATVYFSSATFAGHVRFAGAERHQRFTDTSALDLQFARIEKPDHVSFHTLTLRPYWFVNVDARKFDFTNVDWYGLSIDEEIRRLKGYRVSSPHRLFVIACRNLAVNAEENQRYGEASRFRYMAMDAKRRRQRGGFAFWKLSWWYWLASGYGERVSQAFLVLLGVWFVTGLLYTRVGFVRWEPKLASESDVVAAKRDDFGVPLPFRRALTYSAGVMTLQKPEPRPATTAAQTVVLLETVLGPVQAALLALAIRRKFMR